MPERATLPELLEGAARQHGHVELSFPALGRTLALAELQRVAERVGAGLRAAGVARGELVGLAVPTSPEFPGAFFGIGLAGAVVAPLPLPPAGHPGASQWGRAAALARAAGLRHVVTTQAWCGPTASQALGAGVHLLACETLASGSGRGLPAPPTADDLAIVQYTSGSTARPRGAALPHRSVTACIAGIAERAAFGPDDVASHWLPLFHDMGLISMLAFLSSGVRQQLRHPGCFLRHPGRWLRDFAASRGSLHVAPNFAYAHLLASVTPEEVRALDLRAWRLAFNGGEPVDAACLEEFARVFAPAGLPASAPYPVYGLAEATLAVSFPALGQPPRVDWVSRAALARDGRVCRHTGPGAEARGVVSVGSALPGLTLRIVDERGAGLPDERVGEIEVRGASLMRAYHADPQATRESLCDGWLRSGDLGYLRQGELFVTGRRKQMIVVNGSNHYPEDAESLAREVPALRGGRCVAFGAGRAGCERLVLLAESAQPAAGLARALHRHVAAGLGVEAVDVHVVRMSTLRRTTSGKYQRLLMRELLEQGRLDEQVRESFPPAAARRGPTAGTTVGTAAVPA